MKTPFAVGDRVRVYGVSRKCGGDLVESHTGTVRFLWETECEVEGPDRTLSIAHYKQCRRLIKRPRRRVWITENALNRLADFAENESTEATISKKKIVGTDIEFIEARSKNE